MIRPFTAIHAKGIPLPFFIEDAIITSIDVNEDDDALVLTFANGFYKLDRDGKGIIPLVNGKLFIRMEEGHLASDNVLIARRVHVFHRLKFKRFRKNVLKKRMIVQDILYSHHTKSIVLEGVAKGTYAIQLNNVKDLRFTYYEPHDLAYESSIVNRRDFMKLKKGS